MLLEKYEDFLESSVKQLVIELSPISLGQQAGSQREEGEVLPPLPNPNKFILSKIENMSFLILCFKLQAWRILRCIFFV